MSDYGSVNEIQRKIRDGLFSTFEKECTTNTLWRGFDGIKETGEDGKLSLFPMSPARSARKSCRTTNAEEGHHTCDATLEPVILRYQRQQQPL